MNKKYFIFILLYILMLYNSHAYAKGVILLIKGKVINEKNERISNASITVYNGTIIDRVIIADKMGIFEAKLPVDNNYTIVLSSIGYGAKGLQINTKVSNSYVVNQSYFLTVSLIKSEIENIENKNAYTLYGGLKYNEGEEVFQFFNLKIEKPKENNLVIKPLIKKDSVIKKEVKKTQENIKNVNVIKIKKDTIAIKPVNTDNLIKSINISNQNKISNSILSNRLEMKDAHKMAQFNKEQLKHLDKNKNIMYESVNPLTSLFDVITTYEKNNK